MLNLKGIMENYHSGCDVWNLLLDIQNTSASVAISLTSHGGLIPSPLPSDGRSLPLYLLSFKQWLNSTFHEEKRKLQMRAFLSLTPCAQKLYPNRYWITF